MKNQMSSFATQYAWEWPAAIGVFLIVLGATLISNAAAATVGIAWFMGIAFVVSGLVQFVHAYPFVGHHGWASRFLLAALSVVAGIITLANPIVGAMGITVVLAFYLLFAAVSRAMLGIEAKNVKGRSWLFVSAAVSFFLGATVLVTISTTSLFIPATLLGVDLIFYGISLTLISGRFRQAAGASEILRLRRVA